MKKKKILVIIDYPGEDRSGEELMERCAKLLSDDTREVFPVLVRKPGEIDENADYYLSRMLFDCDGLCFIYGLKPSAPMLELLHLGAFTCKLRGIGANYLDMAAFDQE